MRFLKSLFNNMPFTCRLLGDNKSHIDLLIEERVIKFVAECLKTDDNVTVMAAFKALVIYTKP